MSDLDLALSIALGVGLAAATGFRVFLPMLVVSAAAYTGYLPVGENFAWLGTPSALMMLGVAAVVEILAYYIRASTICSTPWPLLPPSSPALWYPRR
jgi:uncharacterized membrane protein